MLYTIHYDGFNYDNENVTDEFIDMYYQEYPFQKTFDILESKSGDVVEGYEQALGASDHRLSISHVEVYMDKKWVNIHEYLNE